MATSTNIKGLSKHMNQIFGSWEGIDMTLRKETITLDPNGHPISVSKTDSTIKGIISAVPFTLDDKFAGRLEDREVRGLFLWTGASATMPEVSDKILDSSDGSNDMYVVVKILNVDRDINNPVLVTCDLRQVPYEA